MIGIDGFYVSVNVIPVVLVAIQFVSILVIMHEGIAYGWVVTSHCDSHHRHQQLKVAMPCNSLTSAAYLP
jgi:hypothetical protein